MGQISNQQAVRCNKSKQEATIDKLLSEMICNLHILPNPLNAIARFRSEYQLSKVKHNSSDSGQDCTFIACRRTNHLLKAQ